MISASRSGEYRGGFSAVANEVKALAIEAEEATKRVTRQAMEIPAAIAGAIQEAGRCRVSLTVQQFRLC